MIMVVKDFEFGPSLGESSLLLKEVLIFPKELEPCPKESSLFPKELWAFL
jgi:hypothetical protein